MKTRIRFLLTVVATTFITFSAGAVNYIITFTGSGAAATVDSVIVFNLSRGTGITVPAGMELRLLDVNNAVDELNKSTEIASVYPNPVIDNSVFSFEATNHGKTRIGIYSADGRELACMDIDLKQGMNSFQLTLPVGVYLVQAVGNGFSYTVRTISFSSNDSQPSIRFNSHSVSDKPRRTPAQDVELEYSAGNQMLYKGYSGNFCTIVTDKPTESKSTNFRFVDCTDADGNHYAVVHIGTQTWMTENLKTTRYRNNDVIPNVTDNAAWAALYAGARCDFENNTTNGTKYGHLYNWYAVVDSRNIAPAGWHVSTDADWTLLQDYLIANGYNYDGTITGNKIAKSLAATTDWNTYTGIGAIGTDLTQNNSSGFSALPGGYRFFDGTFLYLGGYGNWHTSTSYSSTNAWFRYLYFNDNYLLSANYKKSCGYSVRCVKD